jgi:hypothetical protein
MALHLPTTQCACADFEDFAKQRNGGGGGRERDLITEPYQKILFLMKRLDTTHFQVKKKMSVIEK